MTEKRKPLTRREFGLLIIRQDGKCGCGCGKKLDFTKARRVVDEHLNPLFSGGSNDLENRALWNADCSKAKTSSESFQQAKTRRLSGQKPDQRAKREKKKATGRYRPIANPGWQTKYKRKFNGKVIER